MEMDYIKHQLNPPLKISPALSKVIKVTVVGSPLVMRKDNRYKDGNIRIIKGIVRGNEKTVLPTRLDLKGIINSCQENQ